MKYVINIDLDNPIHAREHESVYMDNDTGMTWTISKSGLQKLKPLEEHETQMAVKIPDVISRKEAIDALMAWEEDSFWDEECLKHRGEPYWEGPSDVIEQLPSVQDEIAKAVAAVIEQPPITRCKDCKHYQFADNRAFGMPVKMCEWFGFEDVDDDDFCSRAERRTDESD